MNQKRFNITVHGIEATVYHRIELRAKRDGTSLNRTIKAILEESLGVHSPGKKNPFADLCGTLPGDEVARLLTAEQDFERVDPGGLVVSAIVLDTNAYVRFLGGDERVLAELGRADDIYLSVIVLGELYAGFAGGSRARQNRDELDAFLARQGVRVLDATRETAEIYGGLAAALKRAGTPIPLNDLWIAAHTFETGSVLVTFDGHFELIPSLRVLRFDPSPVDPSP